MARTSLRAKNCRYAYGMNGMFAKYALKYNTEKQGFLSNTRRENSRTLPYSANTHTNLSVQTTNLNNLGTQLTQDKLQSALL
jgi:hypothetical protein